PAPLPAGGRRGRGGSAPPPRLPPRAGGARVVRAGATRQHKAVVALCIAPVIGILALPREVGDARDRLALPEKHGVASAHLALFACVELHEICAALFRLADEDRDTESRPWYVEDLGGPA